MGILSCIALWYSTPGALARLVDEVVADAWVVQTKWVVSIWILSLHFARISLRAVLASSNITESWTLPKQTQIPEVSDMVCVRTLRTLEGYVPAVVRKMSWKVYSLSTSRPDSLVEVSRNGAGTEAKR